MDVVGLNSLRHYFKNKYNNKISCNSLHGMRNDVMGIIPVDGGDTINVIITKDFEYCYLMIAVCMKLRVAGNKGFQLTHFYVWFRPALSYF